jgi:uncharacterized protein
VDPLFILQMLVIGAAVGLISNALGLGGGIVMVPAFLFFIEGMDTNTAKGTSLLIIAFVALINSWRLNIGPQSIPYRLAFTIAAGSIAGGYLGGWITGLMPDDIVTWLFILFLALVGVRTFFIESPTVEASEVRKRSVLAVVVGFAAGIVGGATGTGGGAVLVPLALMAGLETNARVVALSNMVMIGTAAAAAMAHMMAQQTVNLPYTAGQVTWSLAPLVFVGAMLSAPFGRRLNKVLTIKRRRVVLGVLLVFIALRLIARAVA